MGLLRHALCLLYVLSAAFSQAVWAGDITLKDINGRTDNIADTDGKPTIIHFWATWCGPCVIELPQLFKLQNSLKNMDIRFVYIAADNHEAVQKFLSQHSLTRRVFIDQYGKAMRIYGIKALPSTLFVNKHGAIIRSQSGQIDWDSPSSQQNLKHMLLD